MLSVTKAECAGDYSLLVEFSDSKKGIVDLSDMILHGTIKPFRALQEKSLFQQFQTDYTVKWSDDLDIAPEYLYFKAFEDVDELKDQFRQWGYIS